MNPDDETPPPLPGDDGGRPSDEDISKLLAAHNSIEEVQEQADYVGAFFQRLTTWDMSEDPAAYLTRSWMLRMIGEEVADD